MSKLFFASNQCSSSCTSFAGNLLRLPLAALAKFQCCVTEEEMTMQAMHCINLKVINND